MRLAKQFFIIITLNFSKHALSQQYVQPMRYYHYSFSNQVNIGVGPVRTTNASAYLEVGPTSGANKGFLPPRLTTTQRNSISSPAAGLFIYNSTTGRYNFYNGIAWADISASSGVDSLWRTPGVDSFYFLKNGTTYALKDSLGTTDTSSLSNRINQKLNISDTAAMLSNYTRRQELRDTAAAIRADMGTGGSQDLDGVTDIGNTTTNWAQFGDSLVVEGADPQLHLYGSGFGYKLKANSTDKSLQFINGSISKVNFIIDENGLVGINTLGPSAQLDVQDADGAIATGIFNAHEGRSGEIVNIKQSGVKKFSFNTSGAIDIIESSAPSTPASGYLSIYANSGNSKLYTKNDAAKEAQLIQDLQLVFGAGSGADSDTTAFTTSAIYGSFYNDADTIVVTSMRAVLQGTSPDITYKVWYNDSLNVEAGATALVTAGSQVTNTTTGTNVTSFNVTKIPPGVWVWVKFSTVATKPKYFSLTINGYHK